ncbi:MULTISPECIES: glycoside hydrolase family 9 protein [unclassified Brucella]|uniref:glycoside hydrolase family 9 protein n=2 Tax=Brucella TaxID=234 RepID=UPI000972CAF4|nr:MULTISPECIES: glycoside hydrolase family 9 protein [unclassified Brucella]APX67955.1 hypothetical protein BKD03_00100 [Brucella sp. 09RB8471]MRN77265.1 hypothetical protein [Brucella sp. 10RB9210]CAB4327888.1 Endoglucanase E-4 [Brucella sp. 191011898]
MTTIGQIWAGPFGVADYETALNLSTQFYYAQYSGTLPSDFPLDWRGNSFAHDGSAIGKDLSGGWTDAGDLIKFTETMAFSTTMLSWGGIEYKSSYTESNSYGDLMNHLGFISDYLTRTFDDGGTPNDVSDDKLYVQVGDADWWHWSYWGAPESAAEVHRDVYTATASDPAGDVAGETAAGLASTSILMRSEGNIALADELLSKAESIYKFAEAYPGAWDDPSPSNYYVTGSAEDELAWGAIWLHRATEAAGDSSAAATYLTKAEAYASGLVYMGGWSAPEDKTFSWANKDMGVAVLLAEETGDQVYFDRLNLYFSKLQQLDTMAVMGDETATDNGLVMIGDWGTNRNAAGASFILLQYAKLLIGRGNPGDGQLISDIINFCSDQIDYMLGDNKSGQSYVVGFGDKYPLQPQHNAASGTQYVNSPGPNEHIIYGALVGGPSDTDAPGQYTWVDSRSDYVRNEVAIDYNAVFSGTVAALIDLVNHGWPHSGSSGTGDPVIEHIGGSYGNYVGGNAADETVFFHGGGGNTADGEGGDDTLVFSGNVSDYTILGEGEHFTISHIGSPDTIQFTNFEHLTFDNIASVALTDIVASSGQAAGSYWSSPQNLGFFVPAVSGAIAHIGGTHGAYFDGSAAAETLMFHGGSGNSADGEGGDDTLVFSGNASDYTILGEGDHFTISHIGSSDAIQFTNFEHLTFDDVASASLADIVAASGQVAGSYWSTAQNLGDLVPSGPEVTADIGGTYGNYFGGSAAREILIFHGGSGNSADGRGGDDTLVFSGNVSDYMILGEGDHFTISHIGSSDAIQFTNFEHLTFDDVASASLADIVAASGQVAGSYWSTAQNLGDLVPSGPEVTADIGGTYGNYFGGSAARETLIFHGGSGNTADGEGGDDTLVFSGNVSDYTILGEGEHFTISHIGSPDTIQFTNFEHLTFDNIASVSLSDIVAASGQAAGSYWSSPQNLGFFVPSMSGAIAHIGGTHGRYFDGSAAAETLMFHGGSGNSADGEGGEDTLVFSGNVSDYMILGEGDHFTISHIGSSDTIQFTNFEHLTFDDVASASLADIVAASGQVAGSYWSTAQNLGDLVPSGPEVTADIGGTYGNYFGGSAAREILIFHGGSGNSADGRGGDDTLVFSGNVSDYTILGEGDHFTISHIGSSDTIQFTNFEYVTFDDAHDVSLADIIANAGQQPGDYWYEPEAIGGLV